MQSPRCRPGRGAEGEPRPVQLRDRGRAKPFECGVLEALAFELYPMERARGMAIEAPAVHP